LSRCNDRQFGCQLPWKIWLGEMQRDDQNEDRPLAVIQISHTVFAGTTKLENYVQASLKRGEENAKQNKTKLARFYFVC